MTNGMEEKGNGAFQGTDILKDIFIAVRTSDLFPMDRMINPQQPFCTQTGNISVLPTRQPDR
jgi:hypothetical protein